MGIAALVVYIAGIGVATYLMKVALEDISAYQINLMMGIAMVAIGIPAVLIADGSLELPTAKLGIGVLVAVLMAVGSVAYALALRSLPAGPTAAIATSYVVIVVVLSAVFLHERTDWVTVVGVALTLSGVGVLSLRG